jgi:hypothetical protein
VKAPLRTNPISDSRCPERQITTSVDRQTHDEFELIARQKGTSKAAYLRDIVVREVAAHLKVSSVA